MAYTGVSTCDGTALTCRASAALVAHSPPALPRCWQHNSYSNDQYVAIMTVMPSGLLCKVQQQRLIVGLEERAVLLIHQLPHITHYHTRQSQQHLDNYNNYYLTITITIMLQQRLITRALKMFATVLVPTKPKGHRTHYYTLLYQAYWFVIMTIILHRQSNNHRHSFRCYSSNGAIKDIVVIIITIMLAATHGLYLSC